MNSLQNVEVLKKHDLIVIEHIGVSHIWRPAIFLKAVMDKEPIGDVCISIQYLLLSSNRKDIQRVNTRNSKQRRIYQITKETLLQDELELYNDYLLKIETNDNRN